MSDLNRKYFGFRLSLLTICALFVQNSYATMNAVSTYPFEITTVSMDAGESFKFRISAMGDFTVDCGDGGIFGDTNNQIGTITRSDTDSVTYTCNYASAGTHVIGFDGLATGYYKGIVAAIRFGGQYFDDNTATKIASVSGSLGTIFPTLNPDDVASNNSHQPLFRYLFYGATNLTSLPGTLFNGVSGSADYMFHDMCRGCSRLTSIHGNLFRNISGGAQHMFGGTFNGCSKLTSVPFGLFRGITTPAQYMFSATFADCTDLAKIPATLFSALSGTPADYMFQNTFYGDTDLIGFYTDCQEQNSPYLTYIPVGFFGLLNDTGYQAYSSGNRKAAMQDIFAGTNLATTCPEGTYQKHSNFESDWSGHVSCVVGSEPQYINITYSYNNETVQSQCNYNQYFNLENQPEKQGFRFAGWTYTKLPVPAQSMLAQANQQSQSVLCLIQ